MKELNLLVQKASEAQKNAYAPYSKFRVGAAVLTKNGKIFTGCNIENASYGLTVCAERVAIFNAVSQGHRNLKALAVYTERSECVVSKGSAYPCGACLQVMAEFAPNLTIVLSDGKNKPKIVKLKQLLPKAFRLNHR